jgi:hypothetical protein
MFRNFNWRRALNEAIKVFLAALLGSAGMYLSLDERPPPVDEVSIMLAFNPASLG